MESFIQTLDAEVDLMTKISNRTRRIETPDFADLLWDQVDYDALFRDPGVRFETTSRIFAIARINGELRYYAGGKNIYEEDFDYELGVFGKVKQALSFAEAYLIGGMELTDIEIMRDVRWARFEAKPNSSIMRPHFEEKGGRKRGLGLVD